MTDQTIPSPSPSPARMSLDRLRQIVEINGSAPDRWPEPERAEALTLIAQSADARTVQRAAERVDELLAGLAAPPPSDALAARVKDIGPVHRQAAGAMTIAAAMLRRLSVPLAVGGAGAALVALALWLVVAQPGAPDVTAPPQAFDVAVDVDDGGLLSDVAVVDGAAEESSDILTDADLGTDSAAGDTGGGQGQPRVGTLAGIRLE